MTRFLFLVTNCVLADTSQHKASGIPRASRPSYKPDPTHTDIVLDEGKAQGSMCHRPYNKRQLSRLGLSREFSGPVLARGG